MLPIIDVDVIDTWPQKILEQVNQWADELIGSTKNTADLDISFDFEEAFRRLFSGYLLRAYHCTRFLPHEIQMIKEYGLKILTPDLLYARIDMAQRQGIITPRDAKMLHRSHGFSTNEQAYRENQVCLILSKNMFRDSFDACEPLLTNWGGEAIYLSSSKPKILTSLNEKSSRTIVVALLDIGGVGGLHNVFPALHKVFVASRLQLTDLGADVFYRKNVPAKNIEHILQSGEIEYEALFIQ